MNKKELMEQFEKNVCFLQRNIPPDDIYIFAEQTFMAALYFLSRWNKCEDIPTVCAADDVAAKYCLNIMGFHKNKMEDIDTTLDLGVDDLYED